MDKIKKVLFFIGLIILGILINITPMFLIGAQEKTPLALKWGFSIVYLIVASLIIREVWKKYNQSVSEEILNQPFTWGDFGKAFLYYLPTRLVAVLGTLLIQWVTGNLISSNDAALQATNEQAQKMFVLYFIIFQVAIGLFAPIYEELVFRGFFTTYFLNGKSKWLKLIVSSSVFALVHISHFVEFFMYFALGAIFYLAYARRGNIKDSMMVHFLNNFLIVLISVITYIVLMMN